MNIEYETVAVFDTETTGLLEYKKRNRDPSQPALIQVAVALYRTEKDQDNWKQVGVMYNLVQREGVPIHPKAFEAHGIAEEYCDKYGLHGESVMYTVLDMLACADTVVAHNTAFDVKVLQCNAHRHGLTVDNQQYVDAVLTGGPAYCTMKSATSLVKAKKANGTKGHKWPTLEECMNFFFNESIIGAHDALVDVEACAKVYFELRRRGL